MVFLLGTIIAYFSGVKEIRIESVYFCLP